MGVVSSLSTAVEVLKRNPVLFVAGLVVALVNAAVVGGQLLSTGATRIAWSLGAHAVQLGSLVFVAGAYGMAAEALDGTARLRTLVSAGKENFADALAATLLLVVAVVAAFVPTMVVGLVGFFILVTNSRPGFPTGLLGILLAGIYLLGMLPVFFLQFYLPAVVVSDRSPADALKQSYRLVRHNFLATLGFDAVILAVMAVGTLPTILLYSQQMGSLAAGTAAPMMLPFAGLSPGVVGMYVAATALFGTVVGTFFYVYQVAFYEELLPDADTTADATEVAF